jgi:hypothetical protein
MYRLTSFSFSFKSELTTRGAMAFHLLAELPQTIIEEKGTERPWDVSPYIEIPFLFNQETCLWLVRLARHGITAWNG